jgi:fibronectin type III domain protein
MVAVTTVGPAATADPGTVPSPPTNLTARAGDQLAEVTWDGPLPHDPSITDYTVTPSPADTAPVTVDQTAPTATVTRLTNSTAYTFTVTATNPDGTSPPSAPSPPVTPASPAATTLTLAASPTRVLDGGSVELTGILRQADTLAGIGGEAVTIDQRPAATTTWTPLATVTTAGDGTLDPAFLVTPHAHTDYRLRHPATPFYGASTSEVATVLVGVRLTAQLNPTSIALGRTARIGGQVVPAHAGQGIRLQQKVGRTWRTVQAKPLPATGRFGFGLRPRITGATCGGSTRPAMPITSAPSAQPPAGGLPGNDHRHPRRRGRR